MRTVYLCASAGGTVDVSLKCPVDVTVDKEKKTWTSARHPRRVFKFGESRPMSSDDCVGIIGVFDADMIAHVKRMVTETWSYMHQSNHWFGGAVSD